jgi:starch synthase
MADKLKVLFLASEMVPFTKTGGVAEAASSLPRKLRELGHDVRVALPRYSRVDPNKFALRPLLTGLQVPMEQYQEPVNILTTEAGDDLPVYFVDNERYFGRENIYGYPDDGERFILFCRAAMEMLRGLNWKPDVVHLNDWQTAIVANWLSTVYREDPLFHAMASVYTIHNLAYQGIFGWRILEIAGVNQFAFMYPRLEDIPNVVALTAHGVIFADAVTTVSETYAQEILTEEYGEKLHLLLRDKKERGSLYGILNGIDHREYDPATDPNLEQTFDVSSLDRRPANKLAFQRQTSLTVNENAPLIGCISRLTNQKGFDLLTEVIDGLMDLPLQLAVIGTGDQHYHEVLSRLARRYPEKVAVFLTVNTALSRRIFAASDIFLMPSRFEPCGSNQMVAMRYGSVPVVRRTGGLADTVVDFDPSTGSGTGFVFEKYSGMMLFSAIVRAVETYRQKELWRKLMEAGMRADFSWAGTAAKYVEVYTRAIERRAASQTAIRVG